MKQIYNKNAREKALLEEAYGRVYTEEKIGIKSHGYDAYIRAPREDRISPLDEDLPDIPTVGETVRNAVIDAAAAFLGIKIPQGYGGGGAFARRKKIIQRHKEREAGTEGEEGNPLQPVLKEIEASGGFKETTKQAKQYQFTDSSQNMPAISYTVVKQQQPVDTVTSDGKETKNVAEPNDIIMSGPSKEQYVVKPEKFAKLYDGKVGGTVTPEQSPRMVARVDSIEQPITFKAPWGEDMILKRGDYLVQDPSGGHYRVAKLEYEQTYNPPGERG
jgi:hypothetical protein